MKARKSLMILFALLFLMCAFGCTGQADSSVKNDLFTDEFFSDVVEIRDSSIGQVSGQQLTPVMQYLKGLTLTATDEHLRTTDENGETLYGPDFITFQKGDGTEICFLRNHATLSDLDNGRSYVTEGENLNSGLTEAFGKLHPNR